MYMREDGIINKLKKTHKKTTTEERSRVVGTVKHGSGIIVTGFVKRGSAPLPNRV